MTDDPVKKHPKPKPGNAPQPVRQRGRHRRETIQVPNAYIDKDDPPPEEGELRTLKATDLVEFNRMAESEFVYIVRNLLAAPGAMRAREVCIESAARLDVSIETAKRYLLKHSASISEFAIEKGWVTERKRNKQAR
jgi:hypothetical protein